MHNFSESVVQRLITSPLASLGKRSGCAQYGLVVACKQQVEARSSYLTSLRYNKRQLPVLNRLAWLLATSSDPAVRDGPGALGYATFMMQAPGIAENPSLLGTLAAAQAAAGNFPAAIETTNKAIGILESRQASPEAERHRKRLTLFQQGNALSITPGQPTP